MGSKLSCNHRGRVEQQVDQPTPARIIAADGLLKELPSSPRVAVSDVLGVDLAASFFVCNSDVLYFNQHPPALAAGELLRPGQIYFVLPAAMLDRPLSSSDMAALAVRASAALAAKKPQPCRRRRGGAGAGKKKVRVTPVHEERRDDDSEDVAFNEKLNERTLGEFAVTSPIQAKSAGKIAAAAPWSRMKRALSIIREE